MSYWTYSDLFEEAGPPPTPFHGGFGLMNREGIRKAAWFSYKYLNELRGQEVPLDDAQALATVDGARVGLLVWDWSRPEQEISNRPFFTKVLAASPSAPVAAEFSGLAPGAYRLSVRRTGFQRNDAHTRYLEMGSPEALTPDQLAELDALTRDFPETARTVEIGADGRFALPVEMRTNDVVLVLLEPETATAE
jgi:xylan 1,4-beta-xylosidase